MKCKLTNNHQPPRTMNPIGSNLLILFITNYLSSKMDMDKPKVVLYVRCFFGFMNILAFVLYKYSRKVISENKDTGSFQFTEKYVEKDNEQVAIKTKSNKEYDLEQLDTEVRSLYVSISLMVFLHLTFQFTKPLLMQAIFPLKTFLESPVINVNMFGLRPVGRYERPFSSYELRKRAQAMASASKRPTEHSQVKSD